MTIDQLPVPVQEYPRWRVVFRPLEYRPDRLASLADAVSVVEQSKVRLRGWDYPHFSRKTGQRPVGNDWIGSWANNWGHVEYWRLYQSGQFFHLFAVREAVEKEWAAKLKSTLESHVGPDPAIDAARGFFSLENFVYTVTEIFEFAARLAEKGLYEEGLKVSIRILNADGYALTPAFDRAWSEFRALSEPDVGREWVMSSANLLAASADHSLASIVWFFERFGWLTPSVEVIKKDQDRFLKGLL